MVLFWDLFDLISQIWFLADITTCKMKPLGLGKHPKMLFVFRACQFLENFLYCNTGIKNEKPKQSVWAPNTSKQETSAHAKQRFPLPELQAGRHLVGTRWHCWCPTSAGALGSADCSPQFLAIEAPVCWFHSVCPWILICRYIFPTYHTAVTQILKHCSRRVHKTPFLGPRSSWAWRMKSKHC